MVKKKNRNKQNKSRRNTNSGSAARVKALTNELCGVSDPFCKHARVVSPVGTRANTITFSMKESITITTDADGFKFFALRAVGSSASQSLKDSYNASGDFPATSAWQSSTYTFPSYVSDLRPVSAGVRWFSLLPSTSTGGTVWTIPISDDKMLMDNAVHSAANLYNSPGVVQSSIREPGTYVLPLQDASQLVTFVASSTSTSTYTDHPFGDVLIRFSGPASTNVVQLEYIINYEGLIDSAGSANNFGVAHPERPIPLQYLKSVVGGYVAGSADKVEKTLKDKAFGFAKRIFNRTFEAALHHYLPNREGMIQGQNYAAIMDVD